MYVSLTPIFRGTYAYVAPELYFGEQFTSKADIYSFAIILWEMVNTFTYACFIALHTIISHTLLSGCAMPEGFICTPLRRIQPHRFRLPDHPAERQEHPSSQYSRLLSHSVWYICERHTQHAHSILHTY